MEFLIVKGGNPLQGQIKAAGAKNAITKIAPRSSIMASAINKIFKPTGTRFPNKEQTPKEKAISVAVGIPQPFK